MRPIAPHRLRRGTALLLLLAYLPACTEWHPLPGPQPAARLIGEQDLLVTLRDGNQVELLKARAGRDSVVGLAGARYHKVRTAIALRDIRDLAERRPDNGKTGLAVLGVTAGVLGLALLALAAAVGSSITYQLGCPAAECP